MVDVTTTIPLEPYDPDWPRQFERELRLLAPIFNGPSVRIEHVGSTAVPGLLAKPIIDIMVGLTTLAEAEARIDSLRCVGYDYVPEYEAQIPDRRYFRRPHVRPGTHHLHCVVLGGEQWTRTLTFRDSLRGDPEIAAAYADLKSSLAASHGRSDYAEAKGPFIESVIAAGSES